MVLARLDAGTIRFDANDPWAVRAYEQMQTVRLKVMPDGGMQYLREDDDYVAAVENIVYGLDVKVTPAPTRARVLAPVGTGRKGAWTGI